MKTCLLLLGALGAMLTLPVPGSTWQPPSAKSLQAALEGCLAARPTERDEPQSQLQFGLRFADRPEDLRCLLGELGLWSDAEGLESRRIAKLFAKHGMTPEVLVVADYCSAKHRQEELDRWAFEAFRCATAGRMGGWVREFVKGLFATKASNTAA